MIRRIVLELSSEQDLLDGCHVGSGEKPSGSSYLDIQLWSVFRVKINDLLYIDNYKCMHHSLRFICICKIVYPLFIFDHCKFIVQNAVFKFIDLFIHYLFFIRHSKFIFLNLYCISNFLIKK